MSELPNRLLAPPVVLLHGAALGALAYALAEMIIPRSLVDSFEHDLRLAQGLGLTYPPLIGLWLGWVQRSWSRSLWGVAVGGGIGVAYYFLCTGRNFLAIMVAFPCLLGAAFAGLIGSNRSRPLEDAATRMIKGLIAGFALGSAYLVLANLLVSRLALTEPSYSLNMWKGGAPAMAASSALFLVLLRWSIGLVAIFEPVE